MTETPRLDELVEFAVNPEPRCPCVLLLDTSSSMAGEPIAELNRGLIAFRDALLQDALAARRVEVAIIAFDSRVRIVQDFVTPDRFEPPTLEAAGLTHTAAALQIALDTLHARKTQYRANGIAYYRPWIFMITDGAPQGESEPALAQAAKRVQEEEAAQHVSVFAVGVEGADTAELARFTPRTPLHLNGLNFSELFLWLSASMQAVSRSQLGAQVALPPPGWGTV
ncbi:MAG TPA: VWA domain-containing protein [Chthonomonadaceae bacterium]|nr:VWA domain-containing protein [Chthonomonadaceae bacterium]